MAYSIRSFNIILKLPESEAEISNLDMEFSVKRSVRYEADSMDIVIWNLDEAKYSELIQKDQPIYVYYQIGSDDLKLLFKGFADKNFITRKRINVVKNNNEAAPPDIVTAIKIIESKPAYDNAYINENYRERVSSKQIIDDCISLMGLSSVVINSDIPEKFYETFKAKGKPHHILSQICDAIGLDMVIQNEVVNIGSPDINNSESDIPVFSLNNSLEPEYQNEKEILIITSLQADIYPNSVIKCDFEKVSGKYRVLETLSYGNNYDTAATTNIIIGLE